MAHVEVERGNEAQGFGSGCKVDELSWRSVRRVVWSGKRNFMKLFQQALSFYRPLRRAAGWLSSPLMWTAGSKYSGIVPSRWLDKH